MRMIVICFALLLEGMSTSGINVQLVALRDDLRIEGDRAAAGRECVPDRVRGPAADRGSVPTESHAHAKVCHRGG